MTKRENEQRLHMALLRRSLPISVKLGFDRDCNQAAQKFSDACDTARESYLDDLLFIQEYYQKMLMNE